MNTPRPALSERAAAGRTGAEIGRFLVRALAAVLGGYGAVYALVWALSLWSPFDRATTTFTLGGLMLIPYAGLAVWAFAARTWLWAWGPALGVAALSGVAVLLHGNPS